MVPGCSDGAPLPPPGAARGPAVETPESAGIVFLTHGDGVDTYASDTPSSPTRPPASRRPRGAIYEKGTACFDSRWYWSA